MEIKPKKNNQKNPTQNSLPMPLISPREQKELLSFHTLLEATLKTFKMFCMEWAKLSCGVNFLSSGELHTFPIEKMWTTVNLYVIYLKMFFFSESILQYPNSIL